MGATSICEPEVRKEFVLREGIALDIGSNCGMFTIPMAKMLGSKGKVISIEAEKNNIELLNKNVRLNNLDNSYFIKIGQVLKIR